MKIKTFATLILITTCCTLLSGCVMSANDGAQQQADYNRHVAALDAAMQAKQDQIKIGMTEDQVVSILGHPSGNNVTRTQAGKSEQWVYSGNDIMYAPHMPYLDTVVLGNYHCYLYFENGVLTKTEGF